MKLNISKGIKQKNSYTDFKVHMKPAELTFYYTVDEYVTEGVLKERIECFKVVESDSQITFTPKNNSNQITITLTRFNEDYNDANTRLNPAYNCHGYALMNSKYWINDNWATKILEDEYEIVNDQDCEIVALYDSFKHLYVHTAMYDRNTNIISDKPGILPLNPNRLIPDLLKDFKGTIPKYLKKKNCL